MAQGWHEQRYGSRVDDARVAQISRTLNNLANKEREEVMRSLACAVHAYEKSKDPSGLLDFALDLVTTARLYAIPEYEEALASTPTRPEGDGHDLEAVFRTLRGSATSHTQQPVTKEKQ